MRCWLGTELQRRGQLQATFLHQGQLLVCRYQTFTTRYFLRVEDSIRSLCANSKTWRPKFINFKYTSFWPQIQLNSQGDSMQSLRSLKNPYKASVQVIQKWNKIYFGDFYSCFLQFLTIQLLGTEKIWLE